jgi:predicted dehydrogenase
MEPIKIAIIGSGVIGSIYARICSQMFEVELVAVHDLERARAEKLAQEVNTRACSGSYSDLFRDHPELDGVFICTPQEHHETAAMATLDSGIKNLMIEKPLSADFASASRLAHEAARRDAFAMVAYSLRYDPRYAAMKNAVQSGEIGDITYLYAQRNPPAAALERIKGVELPFWVGVHDIDMLRWVTGSEVRSVFAKSMSQGYEQLGVIGAILTTLTFENGVIAVLENAWRRTTTSSRLLSVASFSVHGTQGDIDINSSEQGIRIVRGGEVFVPDTISMPRISNQTVGMYRNQITDFARCVLNSLPPPIPLAEGLRGLMVAESIMKSIDQQREVVITDEYAGKV